MVQAQHAQVPQPLSHTFLQAKSQCEQLPSHTKPFQPVCAFGAVGTATPAG